MTSLRLAAPCLALAALAACAPPPGPSVPMRAGAGLDDARRAVKACSVHAEKAGKDTLAAGYVFGIFWGGVVIGPIAVAANQENIRRSGAAQGADRCLAKQGYVRRDLTDAEQAALARRDRAGRERLLDHLVSGGSLETYNTR